MAKRYLTSFCILFSLAVLFSSCEELEGFINDTGLSEEEVIDGLKEALIVGTDTSVSTLGAVDGYLADQAVQILLPSEVSNALNQAENVIGSTLYTNTFGQLEDRFFTSLNRAAEDAAPAAKDIFVDAITSISISDAFSILNGADDAATEYLRANTLTELTTAFSSPINTSLDKPLVFNRSSNQYYSDFLSAYSTAQSLDFTNRLGDISEPDLGSYVVARALDGLFVKVAQEEAQIRADPFAYAVDILERVFGGDE